MSKLFPAIASATEKNLIAHPLFEGRLGSYSLPLQIPVRPEESKSVMTVAISLVLQSVVGVSGNPLWVFLGKDQGAQARSINI